MSRFNQHLGKRKMSGLENLKARLKYCGGRTEGRMKESKLKSLKKALWHSYQAETAILKDGREFKCLINPNKLKEDYDEKIISIPFEDVCLNADELEGVSKGVQAIELKSGDVFQWKENGTYWIAYLQRLEEEAYFRANIKKCQFEIDINGEIYRVYVKGPQEKSIKWGKSEGVYFNELNYTLEMAVAKTPETEAFFHRFAKIKFRGKTWEVQAIDDMSLDNIISVYLNEDFSNTLEDEYLKEQEEKLPEVIPPQEEDIYIDGEAVIYPFDIKEYTIKNATGGKWLLEGSKARIIEQTESKVRIEVTSGRSGNVGLIYRRENEDDIVLHIAIDSF